MSDKRSDEVRAWREIMPVHSLVVAHSDERLQRELGLSSEWYEALVEISFAGGAMRMNEFARETTLTKSGATRFVDRLEKAGLVKRTSCAADRRVSQLSLTAKGRRIQQAADPHVLAALDEVFTSRISESEARTMLTALHRVQSGEPAKV